MRTALAAAAVAAVLAGTPARAFELLRVDKNPCGAARNLYWKAHRAGIDPSPLQPARYADLGFTAAARWNERTGAFKFDSAGGALCNGGDGVAAMGFARQTCDGGGFGDALAVTVYTYDLSSGEFRDATTFFDADEPAFADEDFFLEVAMHELGHVLGLDHSDACGDSGAGTLMNSRIYFGAPRLDGPQADDLAGVSFIYGTGGAPVLEGSNSCAMRPPSRRGLPLAPPLGAAALIACRAWRSRRDPRRRAAA